MLEAQRIMAEVQQTGEDPEGRLRQIVEEAVKRGINLNTAVGVGGVDDAGRKRSKREEEGMDGA